MVEKISVHVRVSALNVEHNYLIPQHMSVMEAAELIQKTLLEEYPGIKQVSSIRGALIQQSTGLVLDPGCNFKQLGIHQGERLYYV
ncbi:MAG: hypothetical protein IKL38_09005 [Firmicutes bacterium]|nr:hypothetical protein [Bacillota bacterium]MBR6684470.1 hypothetical protein [Bacillota bacterium]